MLKLALVFIACILVLSCEQQATQAPLTFRINHFQINLDPSTLADIESRKIATLLHSGLIAVDIDGNVTPRIANSWKKLDEKTWAFTLKDSLLFSDGKPVDADAVVNSLCWAMQKNHLYSWSLSSIDHSINDDGHVNCDGVSASDKKTVLIRESNPAPWLFESLDGPAGWIVSNPTEKPDAWGVRPGTGPYTIAQIKSDNEIELASRGNAAVTPSTNIIKFQVVTDPVAAARMFQQGDLDLVQIESPDILKFLTKAKSKLLHFNFQRYRVVIISREALHKKGFTADQIQSFIRAYSASIDRRRLSNLSEGLAQPLETAFPPAAALHDYHPNRNSVDIVGLPLANMTLLTINDAYSDLIASALPQQVEKIKINYRSVESSLLVSALFSGEADMISMLVDATLSAPIFWSSFWTPGASFAAFGTPLPIFANLDFRASEDVVRAAESVDALGNWAGVLQETGYIAVSPRLKGWRLTPSGQICFEGVSVESQ
jgi:ABC-type transport system substrate-binding protein